MLIDGQVAQCACVCVFSFVCEGGEATGGIRSRVDGQPAGDG